jgi:hypothetical protein
MPRRYKPNKHNRLFTKSPRFDQVDWNDWDDVIRRFEQQLRWWYVSPIQRLKKTAHSGFPVVGLSCLLIDTLSQYEHGLDSSNGKTFCSFVRNRMRKWCTPFPIPIRIWNEKMRPPTESPAKDFADVLWSGFRCGIMHEAHAPLYCRLWGTTGLFEFSANGYATYDDTGKDCPVVSLNPKILADEVCAIFKQFLREVKKPANVTLRSNFHKKFLVSYGIDIGNEH